MPCSSPLWIRNRRYFDKTRVDNLLLRDVHSSSLALRPYDIARRWICVPCGRCPDCLRRLRNDWFVRLERELSYQRFLGNHSIFITITISPRYYSSALVDPATFIRKFNERIRHFFGRSIKHAFFQEFGEHPSTGNLPRLHFHGFLFNVTHKYADIRRAIGDLGHIWISSASIRRARYVVKYVTKQIHFNPDDVKHLFIERDNASISLAEALLDSRYTRKFISAHVGDYLGTLPSPSLSVSTWNYADFKNRRSYIYSIPRYYDRYLSGDDKLAREILSAASYARLSDNHLLRSVVSQCFKLSPKTAALSLDASFEKLNLRHQHLSLANSSYKILPPARIDSSITDFWLSNFSIIT